MLRVLARRVAQGRGSFGASAAQLQANRGFSAAVEAEFRPPISVFGIGGKYASALYVAASRAKVLDNVEKELQELMTASEKSPNFNDFLKDPSIPKSNRLLAISEIFGDKGFTDVTKNFLAVLADSGRLSYLPKATSAYKELLRAHRGEVLATVTAALELSPEEVTEIKDALKGFLKPGQTLNLDQKVDRSIIGGVIIDIGENHIDLSIESKIKQMEKVLAEAS